MPAGDGSVPSATMSQDEGPGGQVARWEGDAPVEMAVENDGIGVGRRARGLDALPTREWLALATVIVVALTLMATWPFLGDGIPAGHDVDFHLTRIESIALGLREGVFPVRLYEAQGYGMGYPTGICYPDALLYVPAILRLMGMSLRASYVAFVMLANAATAGIAIAAFKRLFGSRSRGVVCAVLWTLAPYRLMDVLVRASVGEWLALAFLPGVLLGICSLRHVGEDGWGGGWLWLGLSMAGVASSHLLSVPVCCVLCVPFLAWGLVVRRDAAGRQMIELAKAVGIAAALCVGFAFPFLSYYSGHDMLIKHAVNNPARKALYPSQLLSGFLPFKWLHEPDNPYSGGLPMQAGLALLLGLVAASVAVVAPSLSGTDGRQAGGEAAGRMRRAGTVLVAVLCLVLMFATTRLFPWERYGTGGMLGALVTAMGTIQFPWRLLGFADLLLVALWGMAMREANGARWMRTASVVAVALALAECQFATGSFVGYAVRCDGYDDPAQSHVAAGGEYLPAEMDKDAFKAGDVICEAVPSADGLAVSVGRESAQSWRVDVSNESGGDATALLPVLWHAQLRIKGGDAGDAAAAGVAIEDDGGLVRMSIPSGCEESMELRFVEPASWRVAEAISAVALAGIGCVLVIRFPLISAGRGKVSRRFGVGRRKLPQSDR